MSKYIISIDGGSQSCKVVIYDLLGNVICEGRENLAPMYLAEPRVVEHPDDDLWRALCEAAKKAMAAFPGKTDEILGIGVGYIRCCRVLQKKNGELAAPVISWQDARTATPYEQDVEETGYVTSTSGYITHRLTGQAKDCIGNYFGQWPVDYNTWNWSTDKNVIEKFNIPEDMLFEAKLPGDVVGHITEDAAKKTGFPPKLPVICTTADKAVEALGAGLIHESSAVVSLGTYIALMTPGDKMPKSPNSFWGIMSSVPHQFIFEGYGIRRGMWTISWFKELLGSGLVVQAENAGKTPEEFLSKEAERVPPGSDGLMTVLDWLANPWEPFKRGVMIGFDAHMDYAYLYRSILEGIAFTMKNNCDNMSSELGREFKEVIISGGGSNSDLFMQIFADVFNLPAKRNVVNGSASIGAAINTAVGLGVYTDYNEAVSKMIQVRDVFTPIEKNVQLYAKINQEVYKGLTVHTDEVLKKSHAILRAEEDNKKVTVGYSQA